MVGAIVAIVPNMLILELRILKEGEAGVSLLGHSAVLNAPERT
jgi:hypothetical protein